MDNDNIITFSWVANKRFQKGRAQEARSEEGEKAISMGKTLTVQYFAINK